MSGIYIHIPFCKQACHYCDFHFTTAIKNRPRMVDALCRELALRRRENQGKVRTIYLGGGTPSVLSAAQVNRILETVYKYYPVDKQPEITLEANPDDLTLEKLKELGRTAINRLSIGVQSFYDEDLRLMNRAHNSSEATRCIELAGRFYDNLSIDLIYGIPGMSDKRWRKNLEKAIGLEVPHLSCYALTVEEGTALKKFIEKKVIKPVDDEVAARHFHILTERAREVGYEHYEFSNFGKEGFYSENNMAYWTGKPYLGIGPSAHSYDGDHRSWNVANNVKYTKSISDGELPRERERLTLTDKFNEYVMTGLRTRKGIDLAVITSKFGGEYTKHVVEESEGLLRDGHLKQQATQLQVSDKSKFLSDGIASELFWIGDQP